MAKLDAAQAAIDRGNTAAACANLGAFVSQVDAQADKAIEQTDADDLIAPAEADPRLAGLRLAATDATEGAR